MTDQTPFRRGERIAVRADVRIAASNEHPSEATIIDISRFGLSIDGLQRFPRETLLEVQFPDGRVATGRAIWSDEFQDGIAFEPPLDEASFDALLSRLLAA